MSGHGFQFTPMGIIPLGMPVPVASSDPAPPIIHAAPEAEQERIQPVYPSRGNVQPVAKAAPEPARTKLDTSKPLTGKQLMAVAKARIKELDRLLKQVPALEAERESLKRLVDAASATKRNPTVVRSLRASGT